MDINIPGTIFLGIIIVGFIYLILMEYLTVKQQTETKLKVTYRPVLSIGLAIIISPFVFGFFYVSYTSIPFHQITCEHSIDKKLMNKITPTTKQENLKTDCKIVDIDWFQKQNNYRLFPNLLEATIEEKIDSDDEKPSKYDYRYRINLLNDDDNIPLTDFYGEYRLNELRLLKSSINDFLINTNEKILVRTIDDSMIVYSGIGITIFITLIFSLFLLTGLFIDCSIDKENNTLRISRYRCLGIFGKEVSEYALNEIINVKTDGYTVKVLLPGKDLLLTPVFAWKKSQSVSFSFTTFSFSSMSNQSRTVIDIKNFLGMKIMD